MRAIRTLNANQNQTAKSKKISQFRDFQWDRLVPVGWSLGAEET